MRLINGKMFLIFTLFYLGIPMAGSLADRTVEKRFSDVIAHIKKRPTKERPVGTHPKNKKRVFSRMFNTSLSSRAYFQLHTDPSRDASSNKDLEKVAQWYLANPKDVRDPDSAYWAGEFHSAALAQFGSRGTVRRGAVSRKTEVLLLKYMLDFVSYWSRLDLYETSLKHQTYFYHNSENHWWQRVAACWGYLLALKNDPEFKDRKLGNGKSLQEHYKKTSHYIEQYMEQRARKGFLLEISSGGYASRMRNMWFLIHDISPDARMRKLAKNTLDLWWTFWAEEQVSAERGGGKVRNRGFVGLIPNTELHQIPAWLYFGIGIRAVGRNRMNASYMALLSKYRPDGVIYKIMKDRKAARPYAVIQRRLGKEVPEKERRKLTKQSGRLYNFNQADCLKYSWVTPNFVLGTVMRPPYDAHVWNKGLSEGWWHGLLIAGAGNADPPERVVPTFATEKKDVMNDQYAVQSKGSFMTRKMPGKKNTKIPMGIFISTGLKRCTEHKGDFLFINSPRCWVAVRVVGSKFAEKSSLLPKKFSGSFFRPGNDLQPIIIEAADPGKYKGFDAFVAAARKAKLESGEGKHVYHSLSGDVFTMFDDRSKPTINGREINYNPAMAYSSRYVKSKWDSGVVRISAGGAEKVLNFTGE